MQRKKFLKIMATTTAGAMSLGTFKKLTDGFSPSDEKMPVLFVGHGSPMNAIEDNEFTQRWRKMGQEIPRPTAVLVISAHWLTHGTAVTAMDRPKTIHDFGGFPKALFEVEYPAPGNPELAEDLKNLVKTTNVGLDHDWGLDHGSWSVVKQMYPGADVPVLQMSIDYHRGPQFHYDLGRELAALRRKGVLILGSGNMVHNLRMVTWDKPPDFAFDWAVEMNEVFKKNIAEKNHAPLIGYASLGEAAKLAIPTPDHYYPMLYTLGLQEKDEAISFFNDKPMMGSLTMTSVKIG